VANRKVLTLWVGLEPVTEGSHDMNVRSLFLDDSVSPIDGRFRFTASLAT
jgi:hypothetical protein